MQLQQLQQGLLLLLPGAQEGVVVGIGGGVAEGIDVHGGGNLVVFLHIHPVDGSGVAGDRQGRMDIQAAGAQGLTLPGDCYLLPHGGAVIRQKDGGGACQQGIHPAFHLLPVAQGDGYAVALGKGIGFHLHSHIAVQRNHSQRAVLNH